MNLDELERLAKEADEGYAGADPRDSNNWKANQAFCMACTPDRILKLVEIARATKAYWRDVEEWRALMVNGLRTSKEYARFDELRAINEANEKACFAALEAMK